MPIGLFWGYKYSDDDVPEQEVIDWKGNHDLEQHFVNPETGAERLVSPLDLGGVRVRLMLFGVRRDYRQRFVGFTREWWNRFYPPHRRWWI